MSSYATRTSPVLRGRWILDNILAAPPPEPPPDIPNLDDKGVGTATSVRQQLERHRADPTCASCHKRMDPLGFGLENFDGIGAWRTADGQVPIDASGTLPDGRSFSGPKELRAILLDRARRVHARDHRQADDLCARPRSRAIRPPRCRQDGQDDRRRALSLLERGAGDRQQPRLPDAARRAEAGAGPRLDVPPIRGPYRGIPRRSARRRGPFRRSQDDDHHRQAPLPTDDPARPGRDGRTARPSTR